MGKTFFSKAIYIFTAVFFVCMMALAFASCQAVKIEGGDLAEKSETDKTSVESGASDKKSADRDSENKAPVTEEMTLASGCSVKVDPEGCVTRKAVYRIKAGTKVTAEEVKKTGGAGRYFRIFKIKEDDRVYNRIIGKSYKPNPNIGLDDLRYIKTLYYDFDENIRVGEIIVNKAIADDTKKVFRELYDIEYQICRMHLVDKYYTEGGSGTDADNRSMNDDNTSGFNYRTVAGTSSISKHGFGRAIDINPFENPWCPGGKLYPNQKASASYTVRTVRQPHMIFSDSDVTGIFKAHGFRWLGDTDTRDYQHFEK